MNRILISGYYGYDNLGDEAVLETILNNIRGSIDNTEITVLSSNPLSTIHKYGVESIGRSSLLGVFKALLKCDVLISGGGSLLQDVTSRLSIFYYLLIILIGRCMGKKVMIYSQGIGPIKKPFNRWFTRAILNNIHAITVRESYSKKDLIEMGVRKELIEVTADPVVSMDTDNAPDGKTLIEKYMGTGSLDKPNIGFALRGKAYTPDLENRILETIDYIHGKMDANILFIPFYFEEDMKTITEIRKKLKDKVVYIDKRHDATEILSIVKELDVLVGERLHSLIFAAICNVPMVALSYDPKIDYFMETINSNADFNIGTFEPMELAEQIENTWNQSECIKEDLKENMVALKSKLQKNEQILGRLLKR